MVFGRLTARRPRAHPSPYCDCDFGIKLPIEGTDDTVTRSGADRSPGGEPLVVRHELDRPDLAYLLLVENDRKRTA